MRRLVAVFLAFLAASPLGAGVLVEFSCLRPAPAEAGAVRNVSVAARLVDGVELEPGAVFSFNARMRQGARDFVEGTSYASGLVTSSDGGGICQVSSALYNLALLAGLDVLERQPHSVRDPAAAYVPAGLDAAVAASAGLDLRLANPLPFAVRLRASAQGPALKVWLEGEGELQEKRWVETAELERKPKRVVWEGERAARKKEAYAVLRQGFDGLRVGRRLFIADASGNTRVVDLGVDRYLKVNEQRALKRPAARPKAGGKAVGKGG